MLYELLTNEDKEMLTKYINTYALDYSEGNPAPLDYILRIWDDAKSDYLYRMLGNSFFISKDVCVEKSKDEIYEDMERICSHWDQPGRKFIDSVWDYIDMNFPRVWRGEFDIKTAKKDSPYYISYCLQQLLEIETLVRNVYLGPTCTIPGTYKAAKPYVLNTGCKASKALNAICKLFNLNHEEYEEFRVAHSICLTEKKLSGKLTLSIHPLDFMTMSDNGNNWQSCMSWTDHGEYRLGTIEMMNSPMIVEAYLTSSSDYKPCDGVVWNNKKWRELFIVEPNAILGIKGYPYWNRDLEKVALRFIQELAQNNLNWGPYTSDIYKIRNDESFEINDSVFAIEHKYHVIKAETNYMYNDVYGEHNCVVSVHANKEIVLYYSGKPECMCCGSTSNFYGESADTLLCDNCNGIIYCTECGEPLRLSEAVEIDGEYYCEYCADRCSSPCNICGDYHYNDNLNSVYLGVKDVGIIKTISAKVCSDCLDNDERIKTKEIKGRWWTDKVYYMMAEDLSEKELDKIFDGVVKEDLNWYISMAQENNRIEGFDDEVLYKQS